jgi:PAS domain S-box-containing protein
VDVCMMKAIAGQSGFEEAHGTLMAYRPIAGTDWGLIAAQPQRTLYQSLYREVAVIGLSFLVIYLITLFGFWSALKPLAGKILLHAETLEKRIQDKTAVLEKEIAERKRAEEQHRTGEARYRNLFMSSADAIYVNHENRVAMVNAACLQLFGAPSEAGLIGKNPFDLFHPDFHAQMRERIHHMRTRSQAVPRLETRILRLDGSAVDVEVIAAPFSYDDTVAIHVILRDITDRKRHEATIKASLAEKEVLLKEIHHRVKNNMQVISSLVSLQASEVKDPVIHEVLREVCHRVQSMALVHEKLYQSADFARVDFADYIRSLLGYLWRAHGTPDACIRLNTRLEPISLPVNLAVPCALILNELFNNALKHAFGGREEGEVSVSLDTAADDRVRLTVSDDGQGLPPDFDWRQSGSLGLRLVQMLAGQIRARVVVDGDHGAQFTLTFPRNAS